MPRASTTSDVFNAIAEPRRREIVEALAERGPSPVLLLAEALSMPQPALSKHLAVLREVGLVSAARKGRERVYELRAQELKSVHDWTSSFERFWTHQIDRIKQRAEREAAGDRQGTKEKHR